MLNDVLDVMFDVLKTQRSVHRAGGGGTEEARRRRVLGDSQDSTEAKGFDAPARAQEFLEHFRRPAPGGGSGAEEQPTATKKKTGAKQPPPPPPKKYSTVDDQFFSKR